VSFPTRAVCPHERGVFAYLADGPQRGDENDLNWGRYPWVHDTTAEGDHGHLEVCDLMQFALPVDVGEMCACGHSSDMHQAAGGPIPAGMLAKPRPCSCRCPDFRHRREDLERWRAESAGAAPAAAERLTPSPAPPGPSVQLELFAVPAPDAADDGAAHGRRRLARKVPASVPWVETVEVAGGIL
jgi:hypothetical protein